MLENALIQDFHIQRFLIIFCIRKAVAITYISKTLVFIILP